MSSFAITGRAPEDGPASERSIADLPPLSPAGLRRPWSFRAVAQERPTIGEWPTCIHDVHAIFAAAVAAAQPLRSPFRSVFTPPPRRLNRRLRTSSALLANPVPAYRCRTR